MFTSCGLKKDEMNSLPEGNVQTSKMESSENNWKEELIENEQSIVDRSVNVAEKEVFPFSFSYNNYEVNYVVGEEVDKQDILLYENGKLKKTDLYVRICYKCYEKYRPILDELFESELAKYDLDPKFKMEVYSVIEKSLESSAKENGTGRLIKSYFHIDDYIDEYNMIAALGDDAIPYVFSFIYEDRECKYNILLLNTFLRRLTNISVLPPQEDPESGILSKEELDLYIKSSSSKAETYFMLKKYNEREEKKMS